MALQFKEDGHIYESIDDDKIDWISVTSLIAMFKPKFKAKEQAVISLLASSHTI